MHSKRIWGLHPTSVAAALAVLGTIFAGACTAPPNKGGPGGPGDSADGAGNAPGDDSGQGSGGSGVIVDDDGDDLATGDGNVGPGANPTAFPAAAIFADASITPDQVTAFADPNAGAQSGVCVHEPHLSDANGPGALFPKNWLRPRFRWTGAGSETLWEIRLSAKSQNNDLVVYTNKTEWAIPKDLWPAIAEGVRDPITVIIRGLAGGNIVSGAKGDFGITQALAGGSMVFWGTSSSVPGVGVSALYGFTVGDEAVVPALSESQVTSVNNVFTATGSDLRGEKVADAITGIEPGKAQCIGCHNATPDGKAMIFTDNYPWNIGIASLEAGTTGAAPAYVAAGAQKYLKMPFLGTGMMLPADTTNTTLITTMGRNRGLTDAASSSIYINYGYNDPPTYEPNIHDLIWIALDTATGPDETLPAPDAGLVTGQPPWNVDYTGYERQEAAKTRDAALAAGKGTAWGVIASETLSISNPTPAKTSMKVAYAVSESSYDGHPDWHNNTADIKIADLSSPRGTATGVPLAGASDPNFLEYYPAFSPDDKFIAFTRAPAPSNTSRCAQGKPISRTDQSSTKCNNPTAAQLGPNPDGPYYNRNGEIFIVPAAGGTPVRLRANDPVACGGEVSPGVLNSWPKWSSVVRSEENGKDYYFVIFSSARAYPGQFELTPTEYTPPISKKASQLYMSTIEVDRATGEVTTYAAIYLWNQNFLALSDTEFKELKTANLTPAWEDFTIPEVPPVVIFK